MVTVTPSPLVIKHVNFTFPGKYDTNRMKNISSQVQFSWWKNDDADKLECIWRFIVVNYRRYASSITVWEKRSLIYNYLFSCAELQNIFVALQQMLGSIEYSHRIGRTGHFLHCTVHDRNLWFLLVDCTGKPQKLFLIISFAVPKIDVGGHWEPSYTYFLSVNLVIAPGPGPTHTHVAGSSPWTHASRTRHRTVRAAAARRSGQSAESCRLFWVSSHRY